jgi:hypothetical protein
VHYALYVLPHPVQHPSRICMPLVPLPLFLHTLHGWACRYWLAVGADPSERVTSLLSKAGLIPQPPLPPKFPKAQPKATE